MEETLELLGQGVEAFRAEASASTQTDRSSPQAIARGVPAGGCGSSGTQGGSALGSNWQICAS